MQKCSMKDAHTLMRHTHTRLLLEEMNGTLMEERNDTMLMEERNGTHTHTQEAPGDVLAGPTTTSP